MTTTWSPYAPAGDPWITVGTMPIRGTEVARRQRVIEGTVRKIRILEGRSLDTLWTPLSPAGDIWTPAL